MLVRFPCIFLLLTLLVGIGCVSSSNAQQLFITDMAYSCSRLYTFQAYNFPFDGNCYSVKGFSLSLNCNTGTLRSYTNCSNTATPLSYPQFTSVAQNVCVNIGLNTTASFDCNSIPGSTPAPPAIVNTTVTPAPFVHVSGSTPSSCHSGFVWLVLLSCLLFLYL
jgi:hypothetical protein